jgi:transposase
MHRKPRLNTYGRRLIIERLTSGRPGPVVAEELGVSRATVYKWWRRYRLEGWSGLEDRSSRPHRSPKRLSPEAEAPILELRRLRKLGPRRLAPLTGHPRSTCYAVLRRHQLHRLDWLDRPSGNLVRRYEAERPGQLGHVDVKKLGAGSDWRWSPVAQNPQAFRLGAAPAAARLRLRPLAGGRPTPALLTARSSQTRRDLPVVHSCFERASSSPRTGSTLSG